MLLVEDNRAMARLTELLLRKEGRDVSVAHDGPSALSAARAFAPEAVLLNIGLSEDGFEVAD